LRLEMILRREYGTKNDQGESDNFCTLFLGKVVFYCIFIVLQKASEWYEICLTYSDGNLVRKLRFFNIAELYRKGVS